jgi:hypothetical protein
MPPLMKKNLLSLIGTVSILKQLPIFCLLLSTASVAGSQNLFHSFQRLSHPEKHWVYKHPFIARKAWHITQEVLQTTQEEIHDSLLDGKANGGQVDAFRHAYWMTRMTLGIGARKARLLGIAHEQGNEADFRKGRTEEGALSDSIASVMDLKNNTVGIELARQYPLSKPAEIRLLVIDAVLRGKLFILLMDVGGNRYDCSGNRIDPAEWKGQWNIPECLVKSNTRHL